MLKKTGNWYGDKYYFGFHYDFHATENDTEIGAGCSRESLIKMIKLMKPDFVQTDSKGHPGLTSYFTDVPEGTRAPGMVRDPLVEWRAATAELGLPLHCHYSGIWEKTAAKKHPEWARVEPPGSNKTSEAMCPRSPYLEKLMIPQLFELIDKYHVDGFWIDGDLWAVRPCYCDKCVAEFRKRTGIQEAPLDESDPNWIAWVTFTRESFYEYVRRYVDAVHEHAPNVRICSNWLQALKNPGEPSIPTDWISGDNNFIWGLDGCRCEARWLPNRGKPWDIMFWAFSRTVKPNQEILEWTMKPTEMLEQEAAMILAAGGNVQIYETCGPMDATRGLRNGQLVPWRMERLGEVGKFINQRKKLCQGSKPLRMLAILHSEEHYYSKNKTGNIKWGYDITPVQGAVYSLSDNHFGVDVMDEFALKQSMDEFMAIVVPEQTRMSEEIVGLLKEYVKSGGMLFLTGAGMAERFGYEYLGIESMTIKEKYTYSVPVGMKETYPLYSETWGEIRPAKSTKRIGVLCDSPLRDERLTEFPAAISKKHGYGRVVFVPADVFRDYSDNRYPGNRMFMEEIMTPVRVYSCLNVYAPTGIDFIAKTKGNSILLHFINRCSGLPNSPTEIMTDEIPLVGPITVTFALSQKPKLVKLHFGDEKLMSYDWRPNAENSEDGFLVVRILAIKIHEILQIQ